MFLIYIINKSKLIFQIIHAQNTIEVTINEKQYQKQKCLSA